MSAQGALNRALDDTDTEAPMLRTTLVGTASSASSTRSDQHLSAEGILEAVIGDDGRMRVVTV